MLRCVVRSVLGLVFVLAASVATVPDSHAAVVVSTTQSGNDSASSVGTLLGTTVTQLAKIEFPPDLNGQTNWSSGVLSAIVSTFKGGDEEGTGGTWSTTVPAFAIAIKAGSNYIVYSFAGLTATSGNWSTNLPAPSSLGNKGISHITAYGTTTVPIPGALLLFGSAMAGLVGFRRRRAGAPA